MGAQKSFFCVKFPKTKPKKISNFPKRVFSTFRFPSLDKSLCNLALFENAQNLRDKFWNLVCENRISSPERTHFCFWRVFRLFALGKKFGVGCGPLSRWNLAFWLKNALNSRHFLKICLNLRWNQGFYNEIALLKFWKLILITSTLSLQA